MRLVQSNGLFSVPVPVPVLLLINLLILISPHKWTYSTVDSYVNIPFRLSASWFWYLKVCGYVTTKHNNSVDWQCIWDYYILHLSYTSAVNINSNYIVFDKLLNVYLFRTIAVRTVNSRYHGVLLVYINILCRFREVDR